MPDYIEGIQETSPTDVTEFQETDEDGVPDYIEINAETNPEDITSYPVSDIDEDGFPDWVEALAETDPESGESFPSDTDSDGVPDVFELMQATDPLDPASNLDTDEDGHPDYVELLASSDLASPASVPTDTDLDGVPDVIENIQGTDPEDNIVFPPDSDGDGHPDYVEVVAGSNPVESESVPTDTDGDLVPDVVEIMGGTLLENPFSYPKSDTDVDPAYVESQNGTSAQEATDFLDTDEGGLSDYFETVLLPNQGIGALDPENPADDINPHNPVLSEDEDGVPAAVENSGFNNGDGNGDGTLDSLQINAATVPNRLTGSSTTLWVPGSSCRTISEVQVMSEGDLSTQDSGFNYPVGLIDFKLKCSAPGQSAEVTVYFALEYDTSNWIYKKYDDRGQVYAEITDLVTYGTANIGGKTVTTATYLVTDGDPRTDQDGVANGIIHDPAGPAIVPASKVSVGGGGGSVPVRHVVNMCNPTTGACNNVFPTEGSTGYQVYKDCYQKSSKSGQQCATEWAQSNNLLTVADFENSNSQSVATQTSVEVSRASASKDTTEKTTEIEDAEEQIGASPNIIECSSIKYNRYPENRGQGIGTNLFGDTSKQHAAYTQLIDLAEQQIVSGDSDTGNARLDDPVTRGEAVKIMTIAREDTLKQGPCVELTQFPDVNTAAWYHDFVQNMEYQNIVHGYDDGMYRPGKTIIKAELYKILAIGFGFITKEEASAQAESNNQLWFEPYVTALESEIEFPERVRETKIDQSMSRADVFTALSYTLKKVDKLD